MVGLWSAESLERAEYIYSSRHMRGWLLPRGLSHCPAFVPSVRLVAYPFFPAIPVFNVKHYIGTATAFATGLHASRLRPYLTGWHNVPTMPRRCCISLHHVIRHCSDAEGFPGGNDPSSLAVASRHGLAPTPMCLSGLPRTLRVSA